MDRDVVAALNLSMRGLSRFVSSRPWTREEEGRSQASASFLTGEEGPACEAMKGNGTTTLPVSYTHLTLPTICSV